MSCTCLVYGCQEDSPVYATPLHTPSSTDEALNLFVTLRVNLIDLFFGQVTTYFALLAFFAAPSIARLLVLKAVSITHQIPKGGCV